MAPNGNDGRVMSGATVQAIRSLERRTELLAPAGHWDALEAVVEAGADAVYLSGKRFQMRAHRKDFHFDDEALGRAAEFVHARGRRLYVTVNTLLGPQDTAAARTFLQFLGSIGVDAAIVCDLGVVAIARELRVPYELHASTMMNVHDVDQARALKRLGFPRVVTSRDISIQDAGQLGEAADVEIEYFLHGDMCVAQSGQCSLSGVSLGKSANRGECMKPCRWEYDLVALRENGPSEPLARGHLMAMRDLALIRQIPELVEAGICSLKIEGRMRDAGYLRELVGLYRQALDEYYAWPSGYSLGAESLERLFRRRVRDLSTLAATGAPSNTTFFDVSGKREPLILSNGAVESGIEDGRLPGVPDATQNAEAPRSAPHLAVSVASVEAVREALDAGADRVYLSAETSQRDEQHWTAKSIAEAAALVRSREAGLGVRFPRVSGNRSTAEWRAIEALFTERPPDFILVHHLGDLLRATERFPRAAVIADYGFNTLNAAAAGLLAELGAGAVTPSLEAGFVDAAALVVDSPIPVEAVIHGPITGMLLEHCVIAMNLTKTGSKGVCRGPCRQMSFGLRDQKGAIRHVITDQYCRNHVLTERDLAVLPGLGTFLGLDLGSVRIEGQFYAPELVGRLTASYRRALDAWRAGDNANGADWRDLEALSPRPWNYGGYAQRVTDSAPTAEVMRDLRWVDTKTR